MRAALLGLMLASVAGVAVAQDWGNMAVISSTLGNNTNRLCIGDHARPGDIGCPTWAPSLTTAGDLTVSGSVTAAQFVGDGSGLTNVGAASTDRITSGTTSMLAISNTGYISLTQAGTNTGWFDPTRGLVTIGISSTGPISATGLYSNGNMNINGTGIIAGGVTINNSTNFGWSGGYDHLTGNGGSHYIALTTSGTEALRIISTGYVGIGTTQPSSTLHVNGNATVKALIVLRPLDNALVAALSTNTTNSTTLYVRGMNSGAATPGMTFQNSGGTAYMNLSNIASGPAVGIGIAEAVPSATLHVSGTTLMAGTWAGASQPQLTIGRTAGAGAINFARSTDGNPVSLIGYPSSTESNEFRVSAGGGSGYLTLFSGGTGNSYERMRIAAGTGYVGISTSNPNAPLEVNGTISATNLVVNGVSLTGTPNVTAGASGSIIYRDATGSLTASSNLLVSSTTGSVGIGGAPLASIGSNGLYAAGSLGAGGNLAVYGGDQIFNASYQQSIFWGGASGPERVIGNPSNGNNYLAFNTSGTEAVRIVSTGYVGIGTASPSFKLDVNGVIRSTSYALASGYYVSATGSGINSVPGINTLSFRTNSIDNRMMIDSSGNVGISTTAPNAKLDVYGTISATNLVVNGVSITGGGSTTDRIVSGSINAIVDVSSGAVRISGTLALNNTGNEPCDAAHYYTFRANPVTQRLEMCRP